MIGYGVSITCDGGKTAVEKTNAKLCITLVDPPLGVLFCLAKGAGVKTEFIDTTISDGRDISFSFEVVAKVSPSADTVDFGGPFVQGKVDARFVYLNVGISAGQTESPWQRRVKVGLAGITRSMLLAVASRDDLKIMASYAATAKDGGPACASVPLLGDGWTVG